MSRKIVRAGLGTMMFLAGGALAGVMLYAAHESTNMLVQAPLVFLGCFLAIGTSLIIGVWWWRSNCE